MQGATSWSQRQKFKVMTGNQEAVTGRRLEEEAPAEFHPGWVISHIADFLAVCPSRTGSSR